MHASNTPKESLRDEFLSRKNLDCETKTETETETKIFAPGDIKLSADISEHAAWAFQHIYSKPYPRNYTNKDHADIARFCHGIQHVSRAAMYIPILANLYRRHGDKDALALKQDDIKLLQLAALFHDSAREGEEEDRWDHESGMLLYYYLTDVLNISEKKAIQFAEAAINKDFNTKASRGPKKYTRIVKKDTGIACDIAHGDEIKEINRTRNIYQKLIHDADSLDIIRARDHFEAEYLDFYGDIAQRNPQAFDEMAKLITEARSIIETQGDGRRRTNATIKKNYENANAYSEILKTITQKHITLLPALYAQNKLLSGTDLKKPLLDAQPYNKTKPLDEANLRAALREGKVFARAVPAPCAIHTKIKHGEESLAAVEFRKMNRRLGTPTRTLKENRTKKHGNPYRSVSLLGWGGQVYSGVGYMIVDPDLQAIRKISDTDFDSGLLKKKLDYKTNETETRTELAALIKKLKMGGSSRTHGYSWYSAHTEILLDVTEAHAIYTTEDDTLIEQGRPRNPHSRLLQAIFLQNEAYRSTGKKLPLFEYSGIHDSIRELPEFKPQEIISMWVEMCSAYIKNKLPKAHYDYASFNISSSLEKLKIDSVYTDAEFSNRAKHKASADANYDFALRAQIEAAITAERDKIIFAHTQVLLKKISAENLSIFTPDVFYFLKNVPQFRAALKDKIIEEIRIKMLESETLEMMSSTSKGLYPETPIIQIFALATQMELKEVDLIKKNAIAVFTKDMRTLIESKQYVKADGYSSYGGFRITYNYEKIEELISYANKFNLDILFKDQIKELISKLHNDLSSLVLSSNCTSALSAYNDFITYLEKHDLVDKPNLKKMAQIVSSFGKKYTLNTLQEHDPYELTPYLTLASKCDIPIKEQKEVYLSWRKHSKISDSHISELRKSGLLADAAVVNACIAKFFPTREEFLDEDYYHGRTRVSIIYYLDLLKHLQSYLPKKMFTEDHFPTIKCKLNLIVNELVDHLQYRGIKETIFILANEISALLKAEYPLPVSDALTKMLKEKVALAPEKTISPDTLIKIKQIEASLRIKILSVEKTEGLEKKAALLEKKTELPEKKAELPEKKPSPLQQKSLFKTAKTPEKKSTPLSARLHNFKTRISNKLGLN